MRLDKYLNNKYPNYSRAKIQKMIKNGDILINNKIVKTGYEYKENDQIDIKFPKQTNQKLKSEKADLKIVFENDDFFILDKPPGVVVHPSETGHKTGTLANMIKDKIEKGVGDEFRPGIVHRLDKDTSGLLIIAKTKEAYDFFIKQFKERTIKKTYLCLVKGVLDHKQGRIVSPIGRGLKDRKKMDIVSKTNGKSAISNYKVLNEYKVNKDKFVSLLEVVIETGRTHQIRVHLKALSHPIVGDQTYGIRSYNNMFLKDFSLKRQFLHASNLEFLNFTTNKQLSIKSDLPNDLQDVLNEFEKVRN